MKIYFAAPFERGPMVASLIASARDLGHESTARWVAEANGQKDALHKLPKSKISELYQGNDDDVRSADVVVALVSPGLGKEMFCEVALARILGKPIFWVGSEEWMPLSAYRPMSLRVENVRELLAHLTELSGEGGLERVMIAMRAD